jgi:hypothetical protein
MEWARTTWGLLLKTSCIEKCIKTCGAPRGRAVYLVGLWPDRLLGLRFWIALGHWCLVSCECWVWSARGLCDGLIVRPGESYRVWCVWLWGWSFTMRWQYLTGGGGRRLLCQEKKSLKPVYSLISLQWMYISSAIARLSTTSPCFVRYMKNDRN